MRRISALAYSAPLVFSIFLLAWTPLHAQTAPSAGATAAPGQHWWICQYVDPRDLNNPALGSRAYFSAFPSSPSSAASLGEVGPGAYRSAMVKHFIGYVRQNYKVTDLPGNPTGQYTGRFGGSCKRSSDDAAARANSIDMMKKQFPSNHFEGIQVNFADTPAQDAAIDAKLAGSASASSVAKPPSSNGDSEKCAAIIAQGLKPSPNCSN